MAEIRFESIIHAPVIDVFSFYNDLNNLVRITPSSMKMEILNVEGNMRKGTRIEMRFRPLLFFVNWTAVIAEHEPNRYFVDVQEKGPFAKFCHRHEFQSVPEGTRLIDAIDYELPLYPLSRPVEKLFVERKLRRMLEHRHERTRMYLEKR